MNALKSVKKERNLDPSQSSKTQRVGVFVVCLKEAEKREREVDPQKRFCGGVLQFGSVLCFLSSWGFLCSFQILPYFVSGHYDLGSPTLNALNLIKVRWKSAHLIIGIEEGFEFQMSVKVQDLSTLFQNIHNLRLLFKIFINSFESFKKI